MKGMLIEKVAFRFTIYEEFHKLEQKLMNNLPLSDEDMMLLCILPLTYVGNAEKEAHLEKAVDPASSINDKHSMLTTLAGIYTFCDKIITDEIALRIRRRLDMTTLGRMIAEDYERKMAEKIEQVTIQVTAQVTEQVTEQINEKTALTMLEDNKPLSEIERYSNLPEEVILRLAESVGLKVNR